MPTPSLRRAFDDVALCLVFFTRLPLPQLELTGRKLSDAIWAAPLAGLLVGIVGSVVYAAGAVGGLTSGTAAALALAATMLITGCLHEDGLSDVADGFGGGSSRERKLEIMRDSRIGAYGACAIAMSILIRWSAIAALASPAAVLFGLIAAHCASRALMPALMHLLPPARADGLSASAGLATQNTMLAAGSIGLVSLCLLGPHALLATALLLLLALFWWRALCLKQVGGQTGDTIGALQQIGEIIVLATASAFLF